MKQVLKDLSSSPGNPISWVMVIVFLAPVFLLTIKSWVTTSLFLLSFICLWPVFKHPKKYFLNRSNQFWVLLTCLLTPFFAELFAQMGRGEIVGPSLDGPSRMLLVGGIFVFLSRNDVSKLIELLSYGSAVGVMGVALSLTFYPDSYWGIRAATYFVDPITLPCFTVGLLGLSLFLTTPAFPRYISLFVKALLTVVAAYVAVESQSRSAFVAFSCLLLVYIGYSFRHSLTAQIKWMIVLIIGLIFLYCQSDVVYERVNESVSGVTAFLFQDESSDLAARHNVQHTSSGQRLLLGLMDIHLIKSNTVFGIGDAAPLPPFEEMLREIPLLTPEIYEIKVLAGSHSEFLAQPVRQGLIFGLATLFSLFFYPLYLFLFKFRSVTFAVGSPLAVALGIIIPIFASALTIQVFNLKMTTSFYGLCLAIFYAYLCWHIENKPNDSSV